MSAALSQENENREPTLAGPELGEKETSGIESPPTTGYAGAVLSFARQIISGLTGQDGWAKRFTVILSLVVALLGVPGGLLKLNEWFNSVHNPHNLEVLLGDLTITYLPKHEQLKLAINFKAKENGLKNNSILAAKARVESLSLSSILASALGSQTYLLDGGFQAKKPVIVAGDEPRELQCCVVFRLDNHVRELFENVGPRCLVVDLVCENQTCPLSFSFELNDDAIKELFNPEAGLINYLTEDQLTKDVLSPN